MEKNYHINTNCVQAGYSPKTRAARAADRAEHDL